MTYRAVPFPSFGAGLNLRDKTDVVEEAQCIDCLNVVFTERGSVQQRSGFVEFTGAPLTNRVRSLSPYYKTDGTKQLLAGCGTRLETIDTTGAAVANAVGLVDSAFPWNFVRFGAPGGEDVYTGNAANTVRKWNGAAWSGPVGMPSAGVLTYQPWDNRLVATGMLAGTGGPGGATSSPSHVYWSNPGAPESWTTANNLVLTPGDGERITGACVYRELVFVFKETKYFVFYSTTVDSAGIPVFNYRTVDAKQGLATNGALAVGRDGVYFMSRQGVYRTTGGESELVSDLISPIFKGGASVYFESGVLNHAQIAQCSMAFHDERIYLAYPSGSSVTNDRLLVFDPRYNWWSLWQIEAGTSCLTSWRASDQADLFWGYATGGNEIGRQTAGSTTDNGVAITSRWRSGWFDYGSPFNKTIREAKLWGTGEVDLYIISQDFAQTGQQSAHVLFSGGSDTWGDGTGSDLWGDGTGSDLWGPANQVVPVMVRGIAGRGTVFSTLFKNTTVNQSWTVQRLVHHLRETRVPSVVATER